MTNSAVSAVVAQTTNAQFEAWVSEVVTALFTTIGVTQTTDTGQINPATVAIPAINTSAGYVIGKFNDALQATAPVFFKLEFGSGSATTVPQMWLTVGTGSNGTGTITNGGGAAVSTRCAITVGSTVPFSTSTAFTSRYVYLATAQVGFLGLVFKYGAAGTGLTTGAYGAFFIFRTTDNSGNATANGIVVMTSGNAATNPASAATNGYMQCLSFASAAALPATPASSWDSIPTGAAAPFGLAATLESATAFVFPCFTYDPVMRFSAYVGSAMAADFAVGSTSAFNLVGSTPITYISGGTPFASALGYNNNSAAKTFVFPWQ